MVKTRVWFRPVKKVQQAFDGFGLLGIPRYSHSFPKISSGGIHVRLKYTTQKYHERLWSFRNTKRTYRQRFQNVKPTQPWTFRGLCNLFRTTILPLCTPEQNSGEILRSPGNFRVRFPWVVSASLENYKIPPSVKTIFTSTTIALLKQKRPS